MEGLVALHFLLQLIFAVIYILWQIFYFFSEETMVRIIAIMNFFETIILVGTRFCSLSETGLFALGGFYVIEIFLLFLQLLFADFGCSGKIRSIFFILLYVFLFFYDVLNVNLIAIIIQSNEFIALDNFLKNSWFGELLSAIIVAAFKILFTRWLKEEND